MSIETRTESERELSDFGLVSALVSLGFEIRRTSKKGSRIFFVFSHTNELEAAINQYLLGDLQVGARQYYDASKRLKSLIYSE